MFRQLCEKLKFPEESITVFENAYNVITQNPVAAQTFEIACEGLLQPDVNKFEENVPIIAELTGLHQFTIHIVAQLFCLKPLKNIYLENGFSEDFFWRLAQNISNHLSACKKENNIWGNELGIWEWVFHEWQCVRLGRLNFEPIPLYCNASYKEVKKGDLIILVHVPSGEPLKIESVMDSLKQAYQHFKNRFPNNAVPFATKAWLLYPPYMESVFPKGGNLQKFASLFHILEEYPDDTYKHFPYIFGCSYDGDFSKLPQKTTLQKNLLEFLKKGNLMGSAYGILFYDENGIIE